MSWADPVCFACAAHGFPPHGSSVPMEMGVRPCGWPDAPTRPHGWPNLPASRERCEPLAPLTHIPHSPARVTLPNVAGLPLPNDKPGDPAEAAAADVFQPTPAVHRSGYGSDRLTTLRDWLTRHPAATLHSGEGGLLLRALEASELRVYGLEHELERVDELEAELASAKARVSVLEGAHASALHRADVFAAEMQRLEARETELTGRVAVLLGELDRAVALLSTKEARNGALTAQLTEVDRLMDAGMLVRRTP